MTRRPNAATASKSSLLWVTRASPAAATAKVWAGQGASSDGAAGRDRRRVERHCRLLTRTDGRLRPINNALRILSRGKANLDPIRSAGSKFHIGIGAQSLDPRADGPTAQTHICQTRFVEMEELPSPVEQGCPVCELGLALLHASERQQLVHDPVARRFDSALQSTAPPNSGSSVQRSAPAAARRGVSCAESASRSPIR